MSDEVKDNTAETKSQATESKPDSLTLEQKVDAGLATLRGETPLETKEQLPVEAEQKKESSGSGTEKDVKEQESEQKSEVILPVQYRRAAIARGFTEEEINKYLQTNPPQDEIIHTFQPVHDAWQADNRRYAERGRQLVAEAEEETETGKETETAKLTPFDEKELVEKYGASEDLAKALATQLNPVVSELTMLREQMTQSQQRVQQVEKEALLVSVDEFFHEKDMGSFKEFYGVDAENPSADQKEHMRRLGEAADYIRCGALDHGEELSPHEVLTRAHAELSQGMVEDKVRAQIRDSMKARTKTLSSSSSTSSTTSSKSGAEMTREELIKRTEDRMRALRNG